MIGVTVYSVGTGTQWPDRWYFRVRAANGEIVAQSEGYTSKAAAEKGVRALRRALMPGTRDTEAMHEAWVRGYMLSHNQERGWTEVPGLDQKPDIPEDLQPLLEEWSPYFKENHAG